MLCAPRGTTLLLPLGGTELRAPACLPTGVVTACKERGCVSPLFLVPAELSRPARRGVPPPPPHPHPQASQGTAGALLKAFMLSEWQRNRLLVRERI
jgi:hypothetical protein